MSTVSTMIPTTARNRFASVQYGDCATVGNLTDPSAVFSTSDTVRIYAVRRSRRGASPHDLTEDECRLLVVGGTGRGHGHEGERVARLRLACARVVAPGAAEDTALGVRVVGDRAPGQAEPVRGGVVALHLG